MSIVKSRCQRVSLWDEKPIIPKGFLEEEAPEKIVKSWTQSQRGSGKAKFSKPSLETPLEEFQHFKFYTVIESFFNYRINFLYFLDLIINQSNPILLFIP